MIICRRTSLNTVTPLCLACPLCQKTWRGVICVDYRKLNAITKKDKYPLPLVEETLTRLARARVFTKLDVRQAFYRIRMKDSVKDLTTFRTRYGTYRYKVLPFGLCNEPASFQRYINNALFDYLDDFCAAYVDDILIYSEDPLEHGIHVKKVLQRLSETGLQADIKKSQFFTTETKFLGYIITANGVRMDPEKAAAIKDWKPPTTLKGVQLFLGFCNFYRQFLKDCGRVVPPPNEAHW
jgi:Reverse transcriptase (RNA-dependent DNA polymerase)